MILGEKAKLPLVMDSGLSLLDNMKIKNIGKELPYLVNQLIVLDGRLCLSTFQEVANDKIGEYCSLEIH